MSKIHSHDLVWLCKWCGTVNAFTGRKSDERCLACRKFRSSPVWTSASGADLLNDEVVRNAYLLGHYEEVATAATNELLVSTQSRFVRDSIRLALTAELGSMASYWGYADESKSRLAMGWVWPQQPYVSGLTIHLERDGKRAKNSIDRKFGKNKMALNLEFEKALDPELMTLSVSLFYRKERKIETRPLEIMFSREVQ